MNNITLKKNTQLRSNISIRMIATIGILSAISAVLILFNIPLWFAPGFYKLELSEIVVAIGAFTLGPVAGIIIELIKNLLNPLLNGTTTAGIGELSNFFIGCSFIIPSAVIYKKYANFKGALIGLAVGTVSLVIVGSLMNYFILLPMYSYFYKAPLEAFVDMGTAVNSKIVDLKTFVLFATAPFNFVKGTAVSIITLIIYNKLAPILHK